MDPINNSHFNEINQWASKILNSSFGNNYDSLNAIIGPPKNFPNYGLFHENWAQKTHFGSKHFIDLGFPEEIFVEKLSIYEIFNSAKIVKIKLYNKKLNFWKTVWETEDLFFENCQSRLFSPDLRKVMFKTNQIRVELYFNMADGYCQIDAIQMTGKKHIVDCVKSVSNLGKNLNKILSSEKYYDVQFEIDGEILKAHRNILISRGDYFRTLLCENLRPDRLSKPIHLSNITLAGFKALLYFFYTDNIQDNTSAELCCELIRLSDWYEIPKLKIQALLYCKQIINFENLFDFFNSAINKEPKIDEIKIMCEKFITKNYSELETLGLKKNFEIKQIL